MLERLYPLVWRFHEESQVRQQRLDLSLAGEARQRESQQRTWAALTQANSDKLNLQQALGSRDRQVVSLEGEVTRLAAADNRLAVTEAELAALYADRAARDEANGRARREAEARLAALQASTSWRVTAPLRALARLFGRGA